MGQGSTEACCATHSFTYSPTLSTLSTLPQTLPLSTTPHPHLPWQVPEMVEILLLGAYPERDFAPVVRRANREFRSRQVTVR